MKTSVPNRVRSYTRLTIALLGLALLATIPAIAADLNVTGNITATGTVDSDGNTTSFGAKSTSAPTQPGVIFTYTDNSVPAGAVDTFQFLINRNPASWLWLHNTPTTGTYNAMRLDNAHQLILYRDNGTTAGVTLTPGTVAAPTSTLSLGTATLSGLNGAFTATGNMNFTGTDGSLALSASGVALSALGGNKNITLTPSGSGNLILLPPPGTGNVGIKTLTPDKSLHVSFDSVSVPAVKIGSGTDAQGWYTFLGNDTAGATTSYIGNAYNNDAAAFQIRMKGTAAASARLTVLGSGNVGIGTANPGAKLEVNNVLKFSNSSGDSNDGKLGTALFAPGLNIVGINTDGTGRKISEWGSIIQYENMLGNTFVGNTNFLSGNVGIGTTSPSYRLDVNGETHIGGAFRIGELYFSSLQSIGLAVGTERWVKLATLPNNHYVRFQLRSGSSNSEEIAEVKVFGTYFNSQTGISVERQTYNEHLREVRVVGSDGGARTVYIKIRASDYAPSVVWRAIDSKGAITVHNIEETPSGGFAHLVSGNLVSSTNTNIVTSGNVGIGTTSPQARLQLGSLSDGTGEATNHGELLFSKQNTSLAANGGIEWKIASDNYGAKIDTISAGGANLVFGLRNNSATWTEALRINPLGNVGIGTTAPTHKLSVKGTIRAQEIIVDNTGWADYVFDESYNLAPLSDVEAHIKAKKHLPGIPSAAEIAEHGVSMGDMQSKLLSKIEELTLHMIAQEKRIEKLEQENSQLRTASATP